MLKNIFLRTMTSIGYWQQNRGIVLHISKIPRQNGTAVYQQLSLLFKFLELTVDGLKSQIDRFLEGVGGLCRHNVFTLRQ